MIAHVVLLAPRPDLTAAERDGVLFALERAARYIPSVRNVRVGRRVLHGAGYEREMPVGFPFAAIFEFDDLAGLQAYLAHPAHQDLGARFADSLASALVCDYEMDTLEGIRDWFAR